MTRSLPPRTRVVRRCAANVCGDGVVEAGSGGDGAEDGADAAGGQLGAAAVEQQYGGGLGAGPVGAFVEPELHVGTQLGVDGQLAQRGVS